MTGARATPTGAALVQFSYEQLADPHADLSAQIEAAFGPDGLGICVVNGVPGYEAARAVLLPLASALASLPPAELAALEDPGSRWNFGWSHGREKLEGDRVGVSAATPCVACAGINLSPPLLTLARSRADTAKGSFYANPLVDVPTDDVSLQEKCARPGNCRRR